MSKILIVDDLEENIYSLKRTLNFYGYDVITAQNGLEAVEKVRAERPDLVIMDIQMPIMDGHEACRRIKADEETRHIPVIFLTARFPEINDKVKGLDLGADGYLTKPFKQPELISEVRSLLRIKELYDELSDSRNKLKEYNERLEDTVLARTAELRAAQSKLIQSERLSAVGQLVSEMAHEINNPLAIVNNYLRLISDDISNKEANREYITIIGEEVDRVVKIVRDLLHFSKPLLNIKPVGIHEELNNILHTYVDTLSSKGISVKKELSAGKPIVNADPDAIRRVMMNVINNAADAMPGGGEMTVSSIVHDGRVSISFKDTGCGIPRDSTERIFEPFFTTKGNKGTGLGLSISYGIINALNGKIEVDSEVRKGSTITITLPLVAESPVDMRAGS